MTMAELSSIRRRNVRRLQRHALLTPDTGRAPSPLRSSMRSAARSRFPVRSRSRAPASLGGSAARPRSQPDGAREGSCRLTLLRRQRRVSQHVATVSPGASRGAALGELLPRRVRAAIGVVRGSGRVNEALAFLGVCALVICPPGPDTALTSATRSSADAAAASSLLQESRPGNWCGPWQRALASLAYCRHRSRPSRCSRSSVLGTWRSSVCSRSWLLSAATTAQRIATCDRVKSERGARCAKGSSATWPIPRWRLSSSACFLSLCKHLLAVSRRWCHWVRCFVS